MQIHLKNNETVEIIEKSQKKNRRVYIQNY